MGVYNAVVSLSAEGWFHISRGELECFQTIESFLSFPPNTRQRLHSVKIGVQIAGVVGDIVSSMFLHFHSRSTLTDNKP
jgi:hypothetical protein